MGNIQILLLLSLLTSSSQLVNADCVIFLSVYAHASAMVHPSPLDEFPLSLSFSLALADAASHSPLCDLVVTSNTSLHQSLVLKYSVTVKGLRLRFACRSSMCLSPHDTCLLPMCSLSFLALDKRQQLIRIGYCTNFLLQGTQCCQMKESRNSSISVARCSRNLPKKTGGVFARVVFVY